MGCNVLNFFYQLDISLVEIVIIYTLNLGIRGQLSMLAYSPRLQFVTELLDSPKIEAKGVGLVRGSWCETSGFLGLPFDLNKSLTFLGLSQHYRVCYFLDRPHSDMSLFFGLGK